MQSLYSSTKNAFMRFWRAEEGTSSIEFVIIFPIFFGFFLAGYESGMVSIRHMMLERGVDITVREVRIGAITAPTRDELRERICEVAMIINDCEDELQIELILQPAGVWNDVDGEVPCIDRGVTTQPVVTFTNGGNNDLMLLRACVRIDPFLPTTGLGKAIVQNNSDSAAGGSLGLIALSAFVVEPYIAVTTETGS